MASNVSLIVVLMVFAGGSLWWLVKRLRKVHARTQREASARAATFLQEIEDLYVTGRQNKDGGESSPVGSPATGDEPISDAGEEGGSKSPDEEVGAATADRVAANAGISTTEGVSGASESDERAEGDAYLGKHRADVPVGIDTVPDDVKAFFGS